MKHRWLCLMAPLVAGHVACVAVPAATLALGAPILMPICGGGSASPDPPVLVDRVGLELRQRIARVAQELDRLNR